LRRESLGTNRLEIENGIPMVIGRKWKMEDLLASKNGEWKSES
jgi:hypothetical protein